MDVGLFVSRRIPQERFVHLVDVISRCFLCGGISEYHVVVIVIGLINLINEVTASPHRINKPVLKDCIVHSLQCFRLHLLDFEFAWEVVNEAIGGIVVVEHDMLWAVDQVWSEFQFRGLDQPTQLCEQACHCNQKQRSKHLTPKPFAVSSEVVEAFHEHCLVLHTEQFTAGFDSLLLEVESRVCYCVLFVGEWHGILAFDVRLLTVHLHLLLFFTTNLPGSLNRFDTLCYLKEHLLKSCH